MNKNKVNEIIIHHTGGTVSDPKADTSHHTFEQVNEWHRMDPNVWLGYYSSLGYSIGYHYFIDKEGKTTQGRAHTDEGAHTKGHNRTSLGICVAGNFDVTFPTKAQEDALKRLLLTLNDMYPNAPIIPHRHFAQKSCYGSRLADSWAADLIKQKDAPSVCQAEKDEIVKLKEEVSMWKKAYVWIDEILKKHFT